MMDDKKRMQHILSISQQSVTEFVRYLKKKLELSMLKEDLKTAENAEAMLRRLEDRPGKYTIAHVEDGDEQKFRRILEEQNVENFYVNASFMENYNGSWIIPTDQYKILADKGLFKNIQQEREIMVDEDQLDSRLAESNLMTYIRFQEQEIRSVGDTEALESLLNLRAEIMQLDNPVTVRVRNEKNKELEDYLKEAQCPVVQIMHPYMDRYYGCHVIPKALYPELLEQGLIQSNPEMEKDKDDPEEDLEERAQEEDSEKDLERDAQENETDLDEEEIEEGAAEEEVSEKKDTKQGKEQSIEQAVPVAVSEPEQAVLTEPDPGTEPEIEAYPEEVSETVAETGLETPQEEKLVLEEPERSHAEPGIPETAVEESEAPNHSEPEISSYEPEPGISTYESAPAPEEVIEAPEIQSENHQSDTWNDLEKHHPSPAINTTEPETETKGAESQSAAEPVSPAYVEETEYHGFETSPESVETTPVLVFPEEKPQPEIPDYEGHVSHESERVTSSNLPEQEIRKGEQETPIPPETAPDTYEPRIEETGAASETIFPTSGAWSETSHKEERFSPEPEIQPVPQSAQELERRGAETAPEVIFGTPKQKQETVHTETGFLAESEKQGQAPYAEADGKPDSHSSSWKVHEGDQETTSEPHTGHEISQPGLERTSFIPFVDENRAEHQLDPSQEHAAKPISKGFVQPVHQQEPKSSPSQAVHEIKQPVPEVDFANEKKPVSAPEAIFGPERERPVSSTHQQDLPTSLTAQELRQPTTEKEGVPPFTHRQDPKPQESFAQYHQEKGVEIPKTGTSDPHRNVPEAAAPTVRDSFRQSETKEKPLQKDTASEKKQEKETGVFAYGAAAVYGTAEAARERITHDHVSQPGQTSGMTGSKDPIIKGRDTGTRQQEDALKTAVSGRRDDRSFKGPESVAGPKESLIDPRSFMKPATQAGAKDIPLTGIGEKGNPADSGLLRREGETSLTDRKSDIPFQGIKGKGKDKGLVVASDEIKRAIFVGHHDTFEKTVFRAAFASADDTELAQSTRVLKNEQFVSTLQAANAMAVSSLVTRDSETLMRQLSSEQMAVLEKLITGNNCGKFDLSNPALYQESMESMHNYLTRIGVMEKRSVTSSGSLLYSLDENGKVYRGNFFDRKIEKKHIKLEKGIEKAKRKEGKLSSGVAAEAAAKKAGKKVVSAKNRERALEMLQTDLGRIGRSKSEAEALLRIFYKNNKNFASTARIMAVAKKGRQRITTLNPFNNALTAKGIKEDEYSRYIYRAKTAKETTEAAFHVGSMIAKNMHNKNMADIARALNEADKRLAEGTLNPLAKNKLMERREVLRKKQTKGLERGRKWEKRSQKLKKAEETLIKKPQEALKKPLKSMGNGIKKGANHVPGVRRVANFKWSAYMQNHRRLSRIISAPFRAYSKAAEVVVSKFLLPLLAIVGQVLIAMIGVALVCGVVLAISMSISSLFTGEPGTNDAVTPEEIAQTTMGLVYNELQLQESTWVRNLTKSAENTTININDIRYTKIDEGSGAIDENYRNVDAATYIRDILGLEYDAATNRVKVPAPWLGAPEEASYTADGTITGGVELRYIGTGGYPGYTSNIMEIIAMASVANQESILTEYNEDYLSDASDAGVIGKLHGFLNSCLKGLKFLTNTVSEFAEKIVTAMPGGAEFLTRNESKTRAKTYYSYAKPLFNASHQTAYGLTFSFLPTDRTLGMDGAMDMNQFDPDLWLGEGSAGLEEAVDAEVPRQVWTFLKEHGFSDIHAAGVMGNFYQESRFNVNAVQFPGQRKGGIGLGQWTGLTANNNRRLKLENYALAMTGSREGWRNNVDLQLTYMMVGDEPQTVQRYLAQNFASPGEAATWWGLNWERFDVSDGSLPKTRIPAANKYYSLYAGKDLSGDSGNGNGDGTGGGTGNGAAGGTAGNETKKYYSHTPNIDDDGNATEPYRKNMKYQDSVTIDGAKSLKVELWYSTENSYDWLNIRSEEQGPLSNWNSGNAQYSGGNEETKPEDNSENHKVLTIDGDTVYFAFKSDSSVQKYGYYAIVTADKMEADTGWLDDQIEFTNQIPSILVNANVCTGHNGHGCQSYSHFGYGDNSKKYLEYNGNRIDTVYPAALDPAVSNGEVACSAPSGTASEFFEAIDHNPDCWEGELIRTNTSSGRGYRTRGQSEFFDDQTSYGYRVTSENPSQFTVVITVDEASYTDDDGNTEWDHTNETWIFRHKCNQEHTGYYCGGHMRLIIYGVIYHMTTEQRANNHEAYEEKTIANEYLKDYAAPFFQSEENMAKKDLINEANDLFDLDTAIYHVKGSVSKEFPGWNYDHIDLAAAKLEPDWNELYGINASWTINGINAGGAASATMVSGSQVKEIMEKIQPQFPHDGTDRVRYNAIQTAFQYVGKIGYNQKYHGAELRPGSYNDCSGFVSRVYWDVLRQIYNTDSFKSLAIRYGAYRNFTDGQCKPGDIMLHGMESSTRKDNHALLYIGVVDGEPMVIDCSTSGGVGNVFYRSRGSAYYNSATYIDMEVLIKGYLMEHPEMEGDFELDSSDADNGGNAGGNGNTGGSGSKPNKPGSGTKPDKPNTGGSSDGETNKPGGSENGNSGETKPETGPDIDDMTDWEGTGNGGSGNKDPNPDPDTGSDLDDMTDW